MSEDFNWLAYSNATQEAPSESEAQPTRRPRWRLPTLRRARLPKPRRLRLPGSLRFPWRRRQQPAAPSDSDSALNNLLAQRSDRPLGDLNERLRALRERSSAAPSQPAEPALYAADDMSMLPGTSQPGLYSAMALSQGQQEQVELLRGIVAPTSDPRRARARQKLPPIASLSVQQLPRLLLSTLLLLALCLPFTVADVYRGPLPPLAFDASQEDAAFAFSLLDNLSPASHVLVAFEYGPPAAGEMDQLADLLLRHIMARGAKPILVSSNPIAIVHARNIMGSIQRSATLAGRELQENRDFFFLRYLPGGALGLREMSENFADIARLSGKGEETNLDIPSLDKLATILLLTDSAELLRQWAEQVLPAARAMKLIAVTSYGAQPLAQAYAASLQNVVGPLAGMDTAFTYSEMLWVGFGGPPRVLPVVPAQEDIAAQPAVEVVATELPPDSPAVSERTVEPPPPTIPASALPPALPPAATASPLPAATQSIILTVEVVSPQRVNIRQGPTTVNAILAHGNLGDRYAVLGTNGDGSWYKVLLPGGLEGWVAAFLVEEKLMLEADYIASQLQESARLPHERAIMQVHLPLRLGKPDNNSAQVSSPGADSALPALALQRDRSDELPRLDAMTLGTVAAVLVIALGNVFALARSLLGRRAAAQ